MQFPVFGLRFRSGPDPGSPGMVDPLRRRVPGSRAVLICVSVPNLSQQTFFNSLSLKPQGLDASTPNYNLLFSACGILKCKWKCQLRTVCFVPSCRPSLRHCFGLVTGRAYRPNCKSSGQIGQAFFSDFEIQNDSQLPNEI